MVEPLQICEIETNEAFQQNYSNQQPLWKYEVPYSCSSKSQPKKGLTSKQSLTNGTKRIYRNMFFVSSFDICVNVNRINNSFLGRSVR